MWMNEHEIDRAVERFDRDPILGPAARFLSAFRDEVNCHSDGWPYWNPPAKAANKLMTLLYSHMMGGMGAYPELPPATTQQVKAALSPIKAFYARRGNAAGMAYPVSREDRLQAEANSAGDVPL